MSIKYLNYAFQCTEFQAMEKLVMIALCDCVNDNGNGYPGYKTLMKKTSMAKSTLSKHLKTLKAAGVFTTESHGEIGQGRKVNTYHVTEFWKDENLKTSIIEARKERKVRGLDLSTKQHEKYDPHTDTKSMTLEPRKVRGSNPKSMRVEHEPSVLTISNEPSVNSGYVFEGQKIKLNKKDFDAMVKQYSNLDLVAELQQLDLELKNQKSNWFMTMNAKLNYRNKKASNGNQNNQKRETIFERNERLAKDLKAQAASMDMDHDVIEIS